MNEYLLSLEIYSTLFLLLLILASAYFSETILKKILNFFLAYFLFFLSQRNENYNSDTKNHLSYFEQTETEVIRKLFANLLVMYELIVENTTLSVPTSFASTVTKANPLKGGDAKPPV